MKNMSSECQPKEWNSKMISSLITNTSRVFLFLAIVLLVVGIYGTLEQVNKAAADKEERVFSKGNIHHAATRSSRRLLLTLTTNDNEDGDGNIGDGGNNDGNGRDGSMDRVGVGAECTKDNILVFQGATSPLPNGIPTYTVEIQNVCVSESCNISDIHVSCGWFSSARLINPTVFRRIEYDDCLVNNGEPLNPGEALSFQYANTFEYPLSVSSVAC